MVLRLEHGRRSVTHARRWVLEQAAAAGVREDVRATIQLLTSELVANALEHGPDDGTITVRTRTDDGVFEVAVSDQGTGSPLVTRPPPTAEGGRGVMLVDLLAEAWGTRPVDGGGKAVWFTVRM